MFLLKHFRGHSLILPLVGLGICGTDNFTFFQVSKFRWSTSERQRRTTHILDIQSYTVWFGVWSVLFWGSSRTEPQQVALDV